LRCDKTAKWAFAFTTSILRFAAAASTTCAFRNACYVKVEGKPLLEALAAPRVPLAMFCRLSPPIFPQHRAGSWQRSNVL
jgi:hypothetical protein